MSDVTRFSGMFATMAVEYSKAATRRQRSRPTAGQEEGAEGPAATDEAAIRAAMERAVTRRMGVNRPA